MSATISLVEAADPQGLTAAAAQLQTKITHLDTIITAERSALAALAGGWEGTAADAALARGEQHLAQQEQLRTRLTSLQATLADAGANLSALRTRILDVAAQTRSLGGLVGDDGTVIALTSGGLMTPDVAAAYTTTLKTLLQTFDRVDQQSSQSVIQALGDGADTGAEAPPGPRPHRNRTSTTSNRPRAPPTPRSTSGGTGSPRRTGNGSSTSVRSGSATSTGSRPPRGTRPTATGWRGCATTPG
ncbi:WXG100 family type VII secretion target [Mycolicibacterium thermoresistibile]